MCMCVYNYVYIYIYMYMYMYFIQIIKANLSASALGDHFPPTTWFFTHTLARSYFSHKGVSSKKMPISPLP